MSASELSSSSNFVILSITTELKTGLAQISHHILSISCDHLSLFSY